LSTYGECIVNITYAIVNTNFPAMGRGKLQQILNTTRLVLTHAASVLRCGAVKL
jgi:hypothetical protein